MASDRPVMATVVKYAIILLTGALQIIGVGELVVVCDALRMINLDVPQMAVQGDTIQLSCSYSLTDSSEGDQRRETSVARYEMDELTGRADSVGVQRAVAASVHGLSVSGATGADRSLSRKDTAGYKQTDSSDRQAELYAIKWYKDDREFFRYMPQDWPPKQALPMESLNIDVDKSDNQTVVLRNVSLKTSGLFRCEVSTDAPTFLTRSTERKVLIHSLPTEGPAIEPSVMGSRRAHYLGDQLELSCVSRESKPPARLDWVLSERINLTAFVPRDSEGQPSFQVADRRLLRLPNSSRAQPLGREQMFSRFEGTTSLPRAGHSTYALVQTGADDDRMVARSTNNSRPSQTLALTLDELDQFPEITMSTLNFSVDSNLIRLLSGLRDNDNQTRRVADKSWRTRHTQSATSKLERSDPGRSRQVLEEAKSTGREARQERSPPSRFVLRVRCVARVLHLKMSDDIKLTIYNKTRTPTIKHDESTTTTQALENNSARKSGGYYTPGWWIGLMLMILVNGWSSDGMY